MKRSRNPYHNTAKRRKALAWMAAQGIDQPRGIGEKPVRLADTNVKITVGPLVPRPGLRKLRLV